jgi:SAM-dependent methyltransferase
MVPLNCPLPARGMSVLVLASVVCPGILYKTHVYPQTIFIHFPNIPRMTPDKISCGPASPTRNPHHDVFSAERAALLDTRLRRFLYRPDRLAERYVKPGNRVLDFGCGPGFFTREFAKKTGDSGTVIAVDVQEEMLRILREKLGPEGLMPRIRTHRCDPDSLTLSPRCDGKIDAAFTIFVVHEVPDAAKLFDEISTLLSPGGLLFISEPPVIVSGKEFRNSVTLAQEAGLRLIEKRLFFVNRAAVLRKEG